MFGHRIGAVSIFVFYLKASYLYRSKNSQFYRYIWFSHFLHCDQASFGPKYILLFFYIICYGYMLVGWHRNNFIGGIFETAAIHESITNNNNILRDTEISFRCLTASFPPHEIVTHTQNITMLLDGMENDISLPFPFRYIVEIVNIYWPTANKYIIVGQRENRGLLGI